MKTFLFILLAVFVLSARGAELSTAEAQAQAVREFPALAEKGSRFNEHFVDSLKYAKERNEAFLKQSDWPLKLARQTGDNLRVDPVLSAVQSCVGLTTYLELSVNELSRSPFTAEGAIVKLSGITKLNPQEISAGIYQLDIEGESADGVYPLWGLLTAEQVGILARSKRDELYVAVYTPRRAHTKVVVLGNAARARALQAVPEIYWQ